MTIVGGPLGEIDTRFLGGPLDPPSFKVMLIAVGVVQPDVGHV
jgi:hypothetical protein